MNTLKTEMKGWVRLFLLSFFFAQSGALAAEEKALYENDFTKADVGKVPDELMVIDGQFAVREDNGNKVLELPGAPLDTFGVLFGPTESSNVLVSAKVFGTAKGRRYPTFSVGLSGIGGYKLQVSPGKKLLELYKGDAVAKSVPFEWKSGEWAELRLQVRKAGEVFKIEGQVRENGNEKASDWQISLEEPAALPPGRASIWGSPYSGTPIQFDDLKVSRVAQ